MSDYFTFFFSSNDELRRAKDQGRSGFLILSGNSSLYLSKVSLLSNSNWYYYLLKLTD